MTTLQPPHLADDVLLDLAHGLLRGEALQGALDHVHACPSCEHRLQEWQGEVERARAGAAHASHRLRTVSPRRGSARWMWTAAAAAVAAILVLVVMVGREGKPEPEPPRYWLDLGDASALHRIQPHPDEAAAVKAALEAHRRQDPGGVLRALEGAQLSGWLAPVKLVEANALAYEGRYEEAVTALDVADVESLPQPIRDRARWLLYVSLTGSGRHDRAHALLEGLASRPGEFADQARSTLRQRPTSTKPPQ